MKQRSGETKGACEKGSGEGARSGKGAEQNKRSGETNGANEQKERRKKMSGETKVAEKQKERRNKRRR